MRKISWPINGSELARMLGFTGGSYTYHNVQTVRDHLKAIGCEKTGPHQWDIWIVYEKHARAVAKRMGRGLKW